MAGGAPTAGQGGDANSGGRGGFGGSGRGGFDPNMTPEERRKRMEERLAQMTPEERAAFQERMAGDPSQDGADASAAQVTDFALRALGARTLTAAAN